MPAGEHRRRPSDLPISMYLRICWYARLVDHRPRVEVLHRIALLDRSNAQPPAARRTCRRCSRPRQWPASTPSISAPGSRRRSRPRHPPRRSTVAIRLDDDRVLPTHLKHRALDKPLPRAGALAALSWISKPTAFEPVNAMKRVCGCATIALPNCAPAPGQKLTTPSGIPASSRMLKKTAPQSFGASPEGFRITVLPQTIAARSSSPP